VLQDRGNDDLPRCSRQLVARPLERDQARAGDLPLQRDGVPVREQRILGAVEDERRRGDLREPRPPASPPSITKWFVMLAAMSVVRSNTRPAISRTPASS